MEMCHHLVKGHCFVLYNSMARTDNSTSVSVLAPSMQVDEGYRFQSLVVLASSRLWRPSCIDQTSPPHRTLLSLKSRFSPLPLCYYYDVGRPIPLIALQPLQRAQPSLRNHRIRLGTTTGCANKSSSIPVDRPLRGGVTLNVVVDCLLIVPNGRISANLVFIIHPIKPTPPHYHFRLWVLVTASHCSQHAHDASAS